jgi:hypothetical protein
MEVIDFEREFLIAKKSGAEYFNVKLTGGSFIITDKYIINGMNGGDFADFYYQNRLIAGTWLDNIVAVSPWRDKNEQRRI